LVQYKSKASQLFQDLLRDMRSGVVSRMFTYRPRDLSNIQISGGASRRRPEDKETPHGNGQGDLEEPELESGPEIESVDESDSSTAEVPAPENERGDLSRSQKRRRKRR
jgi:preprotein translocase subunit SecA